MWLATSSRRAAALLNIAIIFAFAFAVVCFVTCLSPLAFPALGNARQVDMTFLTMMRCLAIASLAIGFWLIYARRIEPSEWAWMLLWAGAGLMAIELTAVWWYSKF
jgi:FtsH-binding integral membrane protein